MSLINLKNKCEILFWLFSWQQFISWLYLKSKVLVIVIVIIFCEEFKKFQARPVIFISIDRFSSVRSGFRNGWIDTQSYIMGIYVIGAMSFSPTSRAKSPRDRVGRTSTPVHTIYHKWSTLFTQFVKFTLSPAGECIKSNLFIDNEW